MLLQLSVGGRALGLSGARQINRMIIQKKTLSPAQSEIKRPFKLRNPRSLPGCLYKLRLLIQLQFRLDPISEKDLGGV